METNMPKPLATSLSEAPSREGCGDFRHLTYTFLNNRGRITFVVIFFGARGPCPHLLGTTHVKNGHAGGYTHTWRTVTESNLENASNPRQKDGNTLATNNFVI